MVIFAALSAIAGAILFDVIKDSKTTGLYNELKEVAKAHEAYLLDYGVMLEKQAETTELTQSTRKITDLVTVGDKLTGSWGTCSTASTCGTGSQTRSVTCSSAYCDGVKPATSQSCNTPCGSWVTGPWGLCSASGSCGDGIKTRSVTCSTSYCSGTRPASSTACVASSCTYSWYTGSWSECHGSCGMTGGVGDGYMVRNVYCKRSDGTRVSDGYCSGSKPNDRYDGCYFPCT